MEQRCSDAVLCNPCAAGHFDSTRKKTMLIFADYTFRGWPLIREKRESLVPRKFRSIRYHLISMGFTRTKIADSEML